MSHRLLACVAFALLLALVAAIFAGVLDDPQPASLPNGITAATQPTSPTARQAATAANLIAERTGVVDAAVISARDSGHTETVAGFSIEGHVVDADGRGVPNADVLGIVVAGYSPVERLLCRSGVGGHFRIEGLNGRDLVAARLAGFGASELLGLKQANGDASPASTDELLAA